MQLPLNILLPQVLKHRWRMLFLLLILCPGLAAAKEDQQKWNLKETRITLDLTNATFQEFIMAIEAGTVFRFSFDRKDLGLTPSITVQARNESLEDLLQKVTSTTGLAFKQINKNIHVRWRKGKASEIKESPDPQTLAKTMERVVSGSVVSSNGEPMPGVTILLKGSDIGTSTDTNGNFSLEVPDTGGILVFTFIGFNPKEVAIPQGGAPLTITLEENIKALEEVVVIGYGTVKKRDVTGSVGSVSSEELTAFPVASPVMGLQGKTAGVHVLQNSGAPGVNVSVRIRGANSLLGNNEPLYVVDGFALSGNPNAINPNDIASIEVLKDASATAIYGSRGANGVVMITTKSGKAGKTQVTFDSYYAVQQVTKQIDMMNAAEFAQIANERAANDGFPPYFTPDEVNAFGEGTNWQDLLFRSAPMQNHAAHVSGGTEKTQFSVSGSYLGQQGIIAGSDLQRLSLRANVNQKINNKISLTYNATLSNTDLSQIDINGQKGGTVLSAVLVAPPTVAPYNADGSYSNVRRYIFSPNELKNPLAMALERKQEINTKYILAGTSLSYEPVANLVFKTSVGVETSISREDNYSSRILDNTPTGRAVISAAESVNILNENTLTYNKQIDENHAVNALAGATYQQNAFKNFNSGIVTGFLTDLLETNNLQSGSVPGSPESGSFKWVLSSFLGRLNYAYKETYLLTASIRSDGSSRFGEGHKWGYFPSAAFAWRAINEPFAKNLELLSDLKFRLSWGITGSTAVDPYQTLNTLTSYRTVFNDARYIGYAPSQTNLANPNLKWETTAQYNGGLDLGLFQNRLNFTFDYYRKDTRDLLSFVQLPTSTGYASTISNIGKIRNSGVEMGINTILVNKALKWDMNINFSKNKSEVLQLAGGSDVFGVNIPQPLAVAINIVRVGQPVGVFYGYLEDGLDEKGAIKYKDLDGVAGITSADRTIIGDPNPDFLYNLSSSMSYKNFELNYIFQGTQGGDIFNVNLSAVGNSFYWGENQLKDYYDNHWSPANPNPNAKYPKTSSKTIYSASDRYIEDGSFLKLRNLQLAYNLPASQMGLNWLKNLQVYVSGQNLLTLTNYSWYDPEINTRGGSNSISLGIDNAGYPNAKLYTFGIRLGL